MGGWLAFRGGVAPWPRRDAPGPSLMGTLSPHTREATVPVSRAPWTASYGRHGGTTLDERNTMSRSRCCSVAGGHIRSAPCRR